MDSIKWKCKNWIVYFKKFHNFHLIYLIVKRLDVFNFHPIFVIIINCYCYHTHMRDLNTIFKKHTSKVGILRRIKRPCQKLGKLGKFFPRFLNPTFKSDFQIQLGNKKTRNNISEISEISELSEFSNCHFFIFQKKIFFSVLYSEQFRTFCLCYVLFSKSFKVFFPSPKIYVENMTLS